MSPKRIKGPRKTCADCGQGFQRPAPPSRPRGYSYCCGCERQRVLVFRMERIPHPCDACGGEHMVTRQRIYQQRSDRKRGVKVGAAGRILCKPCNAEHVRSITKYADQTERYRESKRRLRRNRHARGFTSNNTKITAKNRAMVDACASQRLAPEGGSLEGGDA